MLAPTPRRLKLSRMPGKILMLSRNDQPMEWKVVLAGSGFGATQGSSLRRSAKTVFGSTVAQQPNDRERQVVTRPQVKKGLGANDEQFLERQFTPWVLSVQRVGGDRNQDLGRVSCIQEARRQKICRPPLQSESRAKGCGSTCIQDDASALVRRKFGVLPPRFHHCTQRDLLRHNGGSGKPFPCEINLSDSKVPTALRKKVGGGFSA